MGKMSDLTMNSSNTGKRLSAASMGYQTLNGNSSSENLGRKTPHFMSPTVSSTKQSHTKITGTDSCIPTPLTSSAKARASGNWVTSAAKRAGFSRVRDSTPRSRKEGCSLASKAISFPDKLSTSNNASLPDASLTKAVSPKFDKAALDTKPLPSPPIIQAMTDIPFVEPRSLIDASEKPLRRSPPGRPHEQEEWPVLFPNRPTTPGTLRQMTPEHDGVLATATATAIYQPAERYPRLSNVSYSMEQKPNPATTSKHQVQRKQVSSPNLRKVQAAPSPLSRHGKENVRPKTSHITISKHQQMTGISANGITAPSTKHQTLTTTTNPHEHQTVNGFPPSAELRQTRTSSLRARLSAGSVKEDTNGISNKVLGFTDFTTEPLATEKDIKRRSTPKPPGAFPASRESLRGRRPAQFVAGSRRPPSRGSLRSESRGSSNSNQLPTLDNDVLNDVLGMTQSNTIPFAEEVIKSNASADAGSAAPRKSSIPVFRSVVPNVTQADPSNSDKDINQFDGNSAMESTADQFTIFEDANAKDISPYASLSAIEESPYRGYHMKRLSAVSPELGPTLKISPSADRIIMGTGSDKENDEPTKKGKDKRRALAPLDAVTSIDDATFSVAKTKRPSSSQGLLRSASQRGIVDKDIRAKKVKSADLESNPGFKRLSYIGSKTPKAARKTTESTNDDPFFDAQSSIDKRISRLSAMEHDSIGHDILVKEPATAEVSLPEAEQTVKEPEWVGPVQKHLSLTADSDALLIPSEVQSMMTHEENPTESVTADILSMMKHDDESRPVTGEFKQVIGGSAELPGDEVKETKNNRLTFSEPTPMTPKHSTTAAVNTHSSSLPPRSSSRTTHPDFINKHSPTSPLSNKEHVPKEFTDRQNRLGSLRGHATSQIDPAEQPVSNRNSVRTSIARESNKTQGSISKGMISNIKGLFHKRSSDDPFASSHKNGKKNKHSKISITSNGSPFPPISEVHPIHRPTLSSIRRTNATPKASLSQMRSPTPSINSPAPSELATTTTMAMQLLESARKERNSPKKERLLELGKILVDAITQARDAEKALEEAKHATRKAEVSYALCKKSVSDVKKVVEEWRDEMEKGGKR